MPAGTSREAPHGATPRRSSSLATTSPADVTLNGKAPTMSASKREPRFHWSESVPIHLRHVNALRPSARTKLRVSEPLPVVLLAGPGDEMSSHRYVPLEFLDDSDLLGTSEGAPIAPMAPTVAIDSTRTSRDKKRSRHDYTDPTPACGGLDDRQGHIRGVCRAPLESIMYELDDDDLEWCLQHAEAATEPFTTVAERRHRRKQGRRSRRSDDSDDDDDEEDIEASETIPRLALDSTFITSVITLFEHVDDFDRLQRRVEGQSSVIAVYLVKLMSAVFTKLERLYASELLQSVTLCTVRSSTDGTSSPSTTSSPASSPTAQLQTTGSSAQRPSCPRCGVCGGLVFPTLEGHGDAYCCGRGLQLHPHCRDILQEFLQPAELSCNEDHLCCNDAGILTCSPCWIEQHLLRCTDDKNTSFVEARNDCRICGQFLLPNAKPSRSSRRNSAMATMDQSQFGYEDFCVAPFIPALISFPPSSTHRLLCDGGGTDVSKGFAVHAVCAAASVAFAADEDGHSKEVDSRVVVQHTTAGLCALCNVGSTPSNTHQATLRCCSAPGCWRNIHVLCAAQEDLLGASWYAPYDHLLPPPVGGSEIALPTYVLRPFCEQHRSLVAVQAPHAILAAYPSRTFSLPQARAGATRRTQRCTLHQQAASAALSSLRALVKAEQHADAGGADSTTASSWLAALMPLQLLDDRRGRVAKGKAMPGAHSEVPLTPPYSLNDVAQAVDVMCHLWVAKREALLFAARSLLDEMRRAKTKEADEPELRKRYAAQCARKRHLLTQVKEPVQKLLRKLTRDEYVLSMHLSLIPELHDYLSDLLDGTPYHYERLDYAADEELRRMRWNREGNSMQQLESLERLQVPMQQLNALTRLTQSRAHKQHEVVLLRTQQLLLGVPSVL